MSLCALSLSEAAADIREGRISSADLVGACLERVEEVDSKVHAWTFLDRDHARQQAEAADLHRKQGKALGPLHGVPVGIKDIFDTADMPTELGSPLWAGRTPRRDAAVVARLRAAGAVIMGKTVTTEYAYRQPGKTTNPHDAGRTPGGSSSGSAAAVAAHMVPGAVGSQTNGSVIRPAAFCGVVGFKPTHGLIPRRGVLLLSRTLDHVGVFARTVADVALVAETLVGFDEEDPDTRAVARPPLAAVAASEPPLPPRLAFVRSPAWEHAEPATREAFAELVEALGEAVAEVELGASFARAVEMHRTIMEVEMAHNLHRDYEKGGDRLSAVLRKLIERGRGHAAVDYAAAVAGIPLLNGALDPVFDEFDAIVTPAAPGEAPHGLETTGDPIFCTLWTYLGTPAVTVPLLRSAAGMPLGVQLVGRRDGDARLLRTARWLVTTLGSGRRHRGQKGAAAGRGDSPHTRKRKPS
ncbi:MAG: glutamyl-tRNA amidotransferase [Candidatus Rokubacteria bacterium GWF2_70_14]|nr:MAG: glutamyl-tRNA amidotransferase [Candidatus Rokubacteria bacterium GWA2_70_23]OGK90132.1 MAG: glutamyl-tRNA amidotransferase [Candidatus Rokubacteria bacterium GWF2_70_14]